MIDIIKEKLGRYGATNALEEENALKEILQEIALYALWRADFFDCALFQGGTSLRILHAQEKVQVLGKAWQAVQNAQAGAALEQGAIEEIGAPQRV